MVEVIKGKSGEWWQMKYRGEVDYLDAEPSEGERRMFAEQVDARRLRADVEANLPRIPVDRKTENDYR